MTRLRAALRPEEPRKADDARPGCARPVGLAF